MGTDRPLEHHGEHADPGVASPGLHRPVPDRRKGRLDGVGRPDVDPMFCLKVIEGQKSFPVLLETFRRLRVLGLVGGKKIIERRVGLLPALGHPDLVEIGLGLGLEGFRQRVQDIGCFVDPAPQYTSLTNVWKRHPLSKRFLTTIQGKDIAEYRDNRLETVGAQTVLHEIGLLSRLYSTAIKEWGMGGLLNPVVQIRKPKMPKARDRRLKPRELDRIVVATESSFLPDLVSFAVETAMRQGELAGVAWDLVDHKKRTVTLPETKNGEKRIVPLSTAAIRILERIPRRIDGKVWGVEPHSISQAFRKAVSRARNIYEKECEEKGKSRIRFSWRTLPFTISVMKPQAASSKKA